MKIRIKFSKTGKMRYVGHLDTMRYFQKAIKRANIDISFSAGFSPHPIMSFALPLGVGVTSDAEYVDIQVNSLMNTRDALIALNQVMADGFQVSEFRLLPEDSKKGMTLVAVSDYEITFNEGYGFPFTKEQFEAVRSGYFEGNEALIITKSNKKGESQIDIKPMIYSIEADYNDAKPEKSILKLRLAAGSVNNLKPNYLLEDIYKYFGYDFDNNMIHVHRTELLDSSCTPLKDLGEIIEQ